MKFISPFVNLSYSQLLIAAISLESRKSYFVSLGSESWVGFNETDALNSFVETGDLDGASAIRAIIQDEELITFHLVGGFLGAGKTTCLLRMAEFYARQGLRVGIIANDQSGNLVDTELFRNAGFDTTEVADGCFCCKFDELITAAGRLGDGQSPNVLLAEPVGSCTDLVATVIKPLKRLYGERFTIAPYVALLDPYRAFQALTGSGPSGFSAKVTYLFKMQQHEADVVAINKIDTLTSQRREELCALVRQNFPNAEVLCISARTGQGFDELVAKLNQSDRVGQHAPNIDYDVYADGEAELGWLNAKLTLTAENEFDPDRLLLDLLKLAQENLTEAHAEPAHIKLLLESAEVNAAANLTCSTGTPQLSRTAGRTIQAGTLLINARVAAAPSVLKHEVELAIAHNLAERNIQAHIIASQDISPKRPTPTYRDVGQCTGSPEND